MPPDPKRRIVEVLETTGKPVGRHELVARTDLDEEECEAALELLRGQQVVRYVSEQDAFRLTYWPDQRECIICSDEITGEECYELELRERATTTDSRITGPLHTTCARDLLDDLSLEGTEW